MSRLRQLCAVIVLACVFAGSAYAGDIHCGTTDPPLPPPVQPTATSQTGVALASDESSAVETALMLLQGVLSVF